MKVSRGKSIVAALIGGAFLALCVPNDADAQEKGTVMVTANGHCKKLLIGGENRPCKGVIYMVFPNGRVMFSFGGSYGLISLSGGKDSQLQPTKYALDIDTIRLTRNGRDPQSYDASGRCDATVSADGKFWKSLVCSANNGLEAVNVDFVGDGTPVKRHVF